MSTTNIQFAVAVHIATVLGYNRDSTVKSAILAGSLKAEPSFVRRSLSKLVKAGLVTTTRGKNGACTLSRPATQISLLDLYQASGAPPALGFHAYPMEERCPVSLNIQDCMAQLLTDAQTKFEQSLAGISVADVVSGIKETARSKDSLPAES